MPAQPAGFVTFFAALRARGVAHACSTFGRNSGRGGFVLVIRVSMGRAQQVNIRAKEVNNWDKKISNRREFSWVLYLYYYNA